MFIEQYLVLHSLYQAYQPWMEKICRRDTVYRECLQALEEAEYTAMQEDVSDDFFIHQDQAGHVAEMEKQSAYALGFRLGVELMREVFGLPPMDEKDVNVGGYTVKTQKILSEMGNERDFHLSKLTGCDILF